MASIIKKTKIMDMRIQGFYRSKARWWLNAVEYDKKRNDKYSTEKKEWAYEHGFLPEVSERYNVTEDNLDEHISIYDYCHIYPVNDLFRKWLKDRVTTRKVLKPYKEFLPQTYFHIYLRDDEPMIIKLEDCPEGYDDTFESILKLIKDKGKVSFAKTSGFIHDVIKYEDEKYYFNKKEIDEQSLIELIKEEITVGIRVVMEYVEDHGPFASSIEGRPNILRLMVYNKYADNPKIGQAYYRVNGPGVVNVIEQDEAENEDDVNETNFMEDQILLPKAEEEKKISRNYYVPVDLETGTCNGAKFLNDDNEIITVDSYEGYEFTILEKPGFFDKLNDVIERMGMYIPQIELMGIDVVITEDGFKFVDFTDQPYYPQTVGFNEEMTDYFKLKIVQKQEAAEDPHIRRQNIEKRKDNFIWTRLTKLLSLPEMRPLIYRWWYVTMREDFFSRNGISIKDKIWAYRHGFLSYRIPQYGITKSNYRNFISDYDYRYLRHINNKYRVWLEDKLTVKYICDKYSEFFPKYYYHFSVRNGEKRVIPLMDLPDYCSSDPESIFELVKNVGALACKPQRGSQGQGFYKFSYDDGKYYLNHEESTKEQVMEILNDEEAQYFVTEYIQQHEMINKIYPGAVNTLRIITFMKDGKTPEIGNAYMRFGSEKTGAVDNMGAGGMFVQVDMETGRFYNGKIITENSILPCSNHPDTGELIEGYLPNWDLVKKGIIDLNREMPQLEYLGFDVAITEDGMKLPEINRAPGYPKIEKFNEATIQYLLYKREMKMKKNNITKTKW